MDLKASIRKKAANKKKGVKMDEGDDPLLEGATDDDDEGEAG